LDFSEFIANIDPGYIRATLLVVVGGGYWPVDCLSAIKAGFHYCANAFAAVLG
jgi:hypothetical protein